ncbi:Pkinase-domain-containing protein [Thelephora ganbajun]|uniref:Pkinase-domain-containing protein n=1 Tax=Thelephora ganbajun TaxID=370292 RepID=A0ACB6Z5I8_THEGA|nr:Pkinase-domain-containing protein [Thelephora ganbajun]
MDSHYSLQVPNSGGPSRGISHPVSVQPAPSISQPQSAQKWASHNIQSSQQQPHQVLDNNFPYDAYSHPAAVAYAAAHPRRTIRKFGPYLVLQTLGEGESGKVKLGLHMKLGEEVAMKLIRKGNVDTPARISKVKREIEILKILKHPNVVRIYDVLETDKYIAIILEYASSGELFDHILAHRYLKEEDACKLFCQLISGVWYIHQKKIVHRDLTLENLLLDRHKNVMIVDFGFANRFEYRVDELMQTRCGSPCYAAPELVISDDMYVGPAMDIWSCGVILYAMLAGYLPFDDDPANPGEDDINLLYEYIVNTPLSFPDYISAEARDLLSIMLVPDPKKRADIQIVMNHRWLRPGVGLFNRTLGDLEHAAMEQHRRKRSAYQRQMKAAATAAENQRMATEPADPDRPDIREESLPGTESLMVSGIGAQQQQHERNLSPTTSLSQVLWNSESDIERHVNEMDDRLENHILSDRERQKLFNELCKICSRHRVIPKSMHIPDCSEGSVEIECGGSANVSQSTYKGYHVAVKAFRVYITSDLDVIFSRFCREGVAWKHLRHLNILPLLGVTISEHQLAMVSLWMENGNINQFIEKDRHTNRTMLVRHSITPTGGRLISYS